MFNKPDAPRNLQVNEAQTDSARVSFTWEEGAENGGTALTQFNVFYRNKQDEEFILIGNTAGNILFYTTSVTLIPNTAYIFKLTAVNVMGESAFSETIEILTASAPGQPSSLVSTALPAGAPTQTVKLEWQAPADDGGAGISGYLVEIQSKDGSFQSVPKDCGAKESTSLTCEIESS
jgi:titin